MADSKRTVVFQVPAELFDGLKEYLQRHNLKNCTRGLRTKRGTGTENRVETVEPQAINSAKKLLKRRKINVFTANTIGIESRTLRMRSVRSPS